MKYPISKGELVGLICGSQRGKDTLNNNVKREWLNITSLDPKSLA